MNLAYKKILGQFTKVLGIGKTLPPHVGKNSQIMSYFFPENVPKAHRYSGGFRVPVASEHWNIGCHYIRALISKATLVTGMVSFSIVFDI